ncbi:hypothetical protein ACHAXT_012409 [Thalassiosira profunda]
MDAEADVAHDGGAAANANADLVAANAPNDAARDDDAAANAPGAPGVVAEGAVAAVGVNAANIGQDENADAANVAGAGVANADAVDAPPNENANLVADEEDAAAPDAGILNAENESSGEDIEEAPTNLFDVWEALEEVGYTGTFVASDIADGSTLTPALPPAPGLRINGVGDVPLPLSDWHAKAIKSNRHTAKIQDGSYHKVHSVEGRRLRIKNPAWEGKFASFLQTVAYRLGVDPKKLSAKLDMLLLMEKGSQVKRCSNAEEDDSVIGTLLVQLPSTFKGGKVTVYNVDGEEDDDDNHADDITAMTFEMGATSGEASFSCHFISHYLDSEYEIGKVLKSSMGSLTWSLNGLPPSDRIVLAPLLKEYKAVDLGRHGINALSHAHRSRFEAIKVSTSRKGWRALILNAEMTHIHRTSYYANDTRETSIVQIFDEEGNDVTAAEERMKEVINLTPFDVGGGMILNFDEEEYQESWGCPFSSSVTTSTYRGTVTDKFVSSFILAYDATLVDAELQCLRGTAGVAEVTGKIVATRNYSMLERVLSVVDSKKKAKFDVSSCKKVLQMLNRSKSKKATSSERIEFVRKTLSGLDSSEPDAELYDAIRAAAGRFGYENVKAQVADLIGDVDRRDRLQLHLFLLRCDFILKLSNGGHENNLLDTLCQALPLFGANKIEDSGVINSTIDSLMSEHGWEAVATVVESTLRFLHSKSRFNRTIPALLDRARLLQEISGHPYGFVQSCLVDFAKDFVNGLNSVGAHVAKPHLRGDNKQIFVKAICHVMEHGLAADLAIFGSWLVNDQDVFPLALEVIVEQANALGFEARGLIHKVLNRCLVMHSAYNWYRHRGADGKIPRSLHVRKIIADYPGMTRTPDEDGRLTLHCAVADKRTASETITDVFESYPEAVAIRCPITGLYPFMLAATSQVSTVTKMVEASFRLLLADPSLVAGGIPVEDDGGSRKRKRSASLDGQEAEEV